MTTRVEKFIRRPRRERCKLVSRFGGPVPENVFRLIQRAAFAGELPSDAAVIEALALVEVLDDATTRLARVGRTIADANERLASMGTAGEKTQPAGS